MMEPEAFASTSQSVEQQVRVECGKYGYVEQVVIRLMHFAFPPDSGKTSHVRVFVLYADHNGAIQGGRALQNKHYYGRKVMAKLYDENLFNMQNFQSFGVDF